MELATCSKLVDRNSKQSVTQLSLVYGITHVNMSDDCSWQLTSAPAGIHHTAICDACPCSDFNINVASVGRLKNTSEDRQCTSLHTLPDAKPTVLKYCMHSFSFFFKYICVVTLSSLLLLRK